MKKLPLKNAIQGAVVTRFPPEASGRLHVGHAKAASLNFICAKEYEGKMIMRFDDTNPAKENKEFEEYIIEDLKLLGITYDRHTCTSDHFPVLLEAAERLIKEGKAYCDNTPKEEMGKLRMEGVASVNRDNDVEKNLKMWEDMKQGTEEGMKTCLRAKISVNSPNKCLRDPVIYRCSTHVHPKTGDTYKVYPTYDFACPLVDSFEGVTHALRTSEYNDRNPQYEWMCKAAAVRVPIIQDFARLNMEFTVMSKRKLTEFVNNGVVWGWDDPRMPTVRGMLRRGVQVAGLLEFAKEMGLSRATNVMEWEKLWAINKKILDAEAPRYTCVDNFAVPTTIKNAQFEPLVKTKLHPKKDIGERDVPFNNTVLLEEQDVLLLAVGEKITLMNWGNHVVTEIVKDDAGKPISVALDSAIEDKNFKDTQKLSWIATGDNINNVKIITHEFDHICLLRSLDKETEVTEEHMNKQTDFVLEGLAEPSVADVKVNECVQFNRRGFYRLDEIREDGVRVFFYIPDGNLKLNHLSAMKRAGKKDKTLAEKKEEAEKRDQKQKEGQKKAAAAAKPTQEAPPAPTQ